MALLDSAKLTLPKSIHREPPENFEDSNHSTTGRHKGDIMSESTSNHTMRHRRFWATSWFVVAAAATAAAAMAVPRYRRNHRGV